MTGIQIFNDIVKSPDTYEIKGVEQERSSKAKERIEQDLQEFCDKLEGFIETYKNEIHEDYYSPEEPDDWNAFNANEENIRAIKFDLMRTIFHEALQQSTELFNLNQGDILRAYGFEYTKYYDSYFLMGKDTYFTDEDALRVADGIYSETLARLEELENGQRSVTTTIQSFMTQNDDGTMYDEPTTP